MKEVTFYNLTVTIEAESPAHAYELLCNALDKIPSKKEWTSDTYGVLPKDPFQPIDEKSTTDLFSEPFSEEALTNE